MEPLTDESGYEGELAQLRQLKQNATRSVLLFVPIFVLSMCASMTYGWATDQHPLSTTVGWLGMIVAMLSACWMQWHQYKLSSWRCPKCGQMLRHKFWNYRCANCHLSLLEHKKF